MRLNIEQRKIIELEPSGHMMIKGVAGSGKTSVAVRRIKFLKEHYCPGEDDHILFVTFNKTLLHYIRYQYEQLENDDFMPSLFESHAETTIQTIDSLMFSYFYRYQKRHHLKLEIVSNHKNRQTMQQAILKVKETFPDIKVINLKYVNFLVDEVQWIKACHITTLQTYQEIDRIGRSEGGEGNPQKLFKNSQTRAAIFKLMEVHENLLSKQGFVDFKTMNNMALQEAQNSIFKLFTHIIIDESQDLSKVQLEFLRLLHMDKNYASIMFVADNTQSIYSQSWLGKGRAYTTIGYDMSGRARILSKNYRTTTEISKAAYALIEHDEHIKNNADFVKPALIDRHGQAPIYRFFTHMENQANFLINEIKSLQNDYALRDICIITRHKTLIDNTTQVLEKSGIPCQVLYDENPGFDTNSIKLTTMHSIKGLEFKVVFLIHLDDETIPYFQNTDDRDMLTEERKLLYVGMTRANELLYMTSVRKPSVFVKEINNQYLRFQKDMALRPFQSIGIRNYRFINQLVDVNSKEEAVRQWLIRELIEIYRYPLEMLSLEYAVQHFSRRGYVDVAVSIDVNGKEIPYIFAEVKAFATGINVGLEQLKSYMQANNDVRYGIVTDGIQMIIIDRNGEIRSDIPPCQPHFLLDTKSRSTYVNIRNRKTYHYLQDQDDERIIEIIDIDTKLILSEKPSQNIPLIGNVAAGIPTDAVEDFEGNIYLPPSWLIASHNTFALHVTGDSMVEAGIDKNDIVIVNRQIAADNNDIVIAVIQEEATMKKYHKMGSEIILMPENAAYEPIIMKEEDVHLNGVVIGVLKKHR